MSNDNESIKSIESVLLKSIGILDDQKQAIINGFYKTMTPIFDKCEYLQGLILKLEESNELISITHDEYYHSYVSIRLHKIIDHTSHLQREALSEYLSDRGFNIDFENEIITNCLGPCMLINHEGDVLDQDSGKWIISKNEYETEGELKSLIEAYMYKTGYYPSIIHQDYHGNVSYWKAG